MPNWMYDPTTVEFESVPGIAPAAVKPKRCPYYTQARRIKVRMALKRVMRGGR